MLQDASGHSVGEAAPLTRGASLATTQHVDPAGGAGALALDGEESGDDADVPEGAVRFEIDAAGESGRAPGHAVG